MPISFLSNPPAQAALRNLEASNDAYAVAATRLVTGSKLIGLGSNPSDRATGKNFEAKIMAINVAKRNAANGLSTVQVAEDGVNQVNNLITRVRELVLEASNDYLGEPQRLALQLELEHTMMEAQRVAESVNFLNTNLLNGEGHDLTFQIGPENKESHRITYSAGAIDVRPSSLGLESVDISDSDSALDSLEVVDGALGKLQIASAHAGAAQMRLHSAINQLESQEEGLSAMFSRINDVDFAKEATEAMRQRLLQSAQVAVLAQANTVPGLLLKLLDKDAK